MRNRCHYGKAPRQGSSAAFDCLEIGTLINSAISAARLQLNGLHRCWTRQPKNISLLISLINKARSLRPMQSQCSLATPLLVPFFRLIFFYFTYILSHFPTLGFPISFNSPLEVRMTAHISSCCHIYNASPIQCTMSHFIGSATMRGHLAVSRA